MAEPDSNRPTTPDSTTIRPTILRPPVPTPTWQIVVGLLLVLPAFALLVYSYLIPAAWTVTHSFQRLEALRTSAAPAGEGGGGLGGGGVGGGGVGLDNYRQALDAGLRGQFGFALSLAVVPLAVVLIVAPVLALLAHHGGTAARWITRGLFALPLASYAPVAIVTGWRLRAVGDRVQDPAAVAGLARQAYWWGWFGLVTALAVTLYLAALRRRDPLRSPWPALAVTAGLAGAAIIAAAMQEFALPAVFGVAPNTATPIYAMVYSSFNRFQFGPAAAIATVMLAVLMLLGLAATVTIILSGLRLEFDDGYPSADTLAAHSAGVHATAPGGTGWRSVPQLVWLVLAAVAALVVLLIAWYGLGPWLRELPGVGAELRPSGRSAAAIPRNTWLPPLISTIVGVSAAALAAFGIGALRPLGRYSEWLLLPFGLFLFVGLGPSALRTYAQGRVAGRLDTFAALIPPAWLAIPALFALTLFFRGQSMRREASRRIGGPDSLAPVVLPVLPMVALAGLVTWVVKAQELLWPFISATGDQRNGLTTALQAAVRLERPEAVPFGLVLPVGVLVALVVSTIAVQLLYLDRIAVRVGRPER